MAPQELDLDPRFQAAGADYLAALQRLGLDPDALFWANDHIVADLVLVLVTTQIDRVGPLKLSELLFRAHNLAATPAEISPFIIRMHSPDQSIIQEINRLLAAKVEVQDANTGKIIPGTFNGSGLSFRSDWIYKFNMPPRRSPVDLQRQWKRFERSVEKLAA